MNIRQAIEADATAIAKIHIETWQHAYRGQVPDAFLDNLPSSIGARTKKWKETIAKTERGLRLLVAEDHGKITGFCIVNRCRDDDMDENTGELGAIYIDPASMKQGAGSALMEQSLQFLKEEGFTKATLWVLSSNEKARKWYESRGWKLEGKTKVDDRGEVQLHEIRYQITL